MGLMTRDDLIDQAALASGNDQSTRFIGIWLDAWLQRTAKSWAWPTLKWRFPDVSVPAGQNRFDIGVGIPILDQGNGFFVHRIFNPLFYRTSDYRQRGRILIRELLDGNPDKDESVTLASNRLGAPTTCKIRTMTPFTAVDSDNDFLGGAFTVYLDPVPDKEYLISLDVHVIPAPLTEGGGEIIPWYPSDRTLLQAVKCAALEMDDAGEGGQAFDKEMAKLSAMVVDDRDYDGHAPGDNELMSLDRSTFL